jgi:rod shape-determining protein MreC
MARNADVRTGDLLVSSGLGSRFPAGYPVATVSEVRGDSGEPFLLVSARPMAALDRVREVLLVKPRSAAEPGPDPGESEVTAPPVAPPADTRAPSLPAVTPVAPAAPADTRAAPPAVGTSAPPADTEDVTPAAAPPPDATATEPDTTPGDSVPAQDGAAAGEPENAPQ